MTTTSAPIQTPPVEIDTDQTDMIVVTSTAVTLAADVTVREVPSGIYVFRDKPDDDDTDDGDTIDGGRGFLSRYLNVDRREGRNYNGREVYITPDGVPVAVAQSLADWIGAPTPAAQAFHTTDRLRTIYG